MYPQLFSMIAPNLFQGGTDDLDVIHLPVTNNRPRADLPFDAIVTMYAWARPADWNVQEFRYGVPDASIKDIDLQRLKQAQRIAHKILLVITGIFIGLRKFVALTLTHSF